MRFRLITVLCVSALAVLAGCGQKDSLDKEFEAYEASIEAESAKSLADGKAFLAKIAKEPGVVALPNGLMYKVLASPNPAAAKPSVLDKVKVNYEGTLTNGRVFDSSYARNQPATFPLGGVIEAWQVGIPLMHKGDTIMLYVPSELGYGAQDRSPDIPPNSVLVFKVELLDINPK